MYELFHKCECGDWLMLVYSRDYSDGVLSVEHVVVGANGPSFSTATPTCSWPMRDFTFTVVDELAFWSDVWPTLTPKTVEAL